MARMRIERSFADVAGDRVKLSKAILEDRRSPTQLGFQEINAAQAVFVLAARRRRTRQRRHPYGVAVGRNSGRTLPTACRCNPFPMKR